MPRQKQLKPQLTEVEQLKEKVSELEAEIRYWKNREKELFTTISEMTSKGIDYWKPEHNERGAGRKPKVETEADRQLKQDIKAYRGEGMSYRAIAEKTGLSLGQVHKIDNS